MTAEAQRGLGPQPNFGACVFNAETRRTRSNTRRTHRSPQRRGDTEENKLGAGGLADGECRVVLGAGGRGGTREIFAARDNSEN